MDGFSTGQSAYGYAYDEAMKRIQGMDNDSEELAMQVLSWIVSAETQLKVNELQNALAIEEGESELDEENEPQVEDMVSVCAGLVTVDEQSGVIRLVHYTTQEYFERTRQQWFPEADRDISLKCLTYLSFSTFDSDLCQCGLEWDKRIKENPFFLYAACNWGHHVRRCSGLLHQVLAFFEQDNQMQAAAQIMLDTEFTDDYMRCENIPQVSGLHLAAYFGQLDVIRSLLDNGQDANSPDGFYYTPLMYASRKGHEAVVSLLLENMSQPLPYQLNINSDTPLSLAAEAGHEGVVKIFLTFQGSVISMENGDCKEALFRAITNGHEAIVKLFLADRRIDADLNGTFETKLLSRAAENGHEKLVKLFLARDGVVADAKDDYGRTPLMKAALLGYESVVKLLLSEKDVDPDSRDSDGRTPLSRASQHGHKAIVQLLLETGAVNPDSRCKEGLTPFAYTMMGQNLFANASLYGCMMACARLLDSGRVDPDSESNKGNTPLILATQEKLSVAVKLLLMLDVNPGHQNKDGESALWWAAEVGSFDIVQLLLEIPSVDPNAEDKRGSTALSRAALRGHRNIIELLLADNRADPHIQDKKGRPPFFYAAYNSNRDSNIEVARLLFNKNNDAVDARDEDGRTPLSWAAASDCPQTMQLLLEDGNADANSIDINGRSVLWHAATGSREAVDLLLHQPGIDVNAADNKNGRTPLMRAASTKPEVVEALLAVDGININLKDRHLRTALSWAARKNEYPALKLLLASKDIETDLPDIDGRTPLSLVSEERYGEQLGRNAYCNVGLDLDEEHNRHLWRLCATKLLLSEGRANPNSKDATGRTPLSWAAQGGNEDIVRVLLDAMDGEVIDQEDDNGETPMAYAAKNNHDNVVKILQDRGARPVELPEDGTSGSSTQAINAWSFEERDDFEEEAYKEADAGFSRIVQNVFREMCPMKFTYD